MLMKQNKSICDSSFISNAKICYFGILQDCRIHGKTFHYMVLKPNSSEREEIEVCILWLIEASLVKGSLHFSAQWDQG